MYSSGTASGGSPEAKAGSESNASSPDRANTTPGLFDRRRDCNGTEDMTVTGDDYHAG